MRNIRRIKRLGTVSATLLALACLPGSSLAQAQETSFAEMAGKWVPIPPGKPDSEMLEKAVAAVNFIKRMELPQASKAINEALQLDARNSYLHFFNGFIYHLQARQGDSQKYALALEGYKQALRLDPGNWISQEFMGLAYLDQKQFDQAREQFSEVLLMTPESTASIYGLMLASYMTGDAGTACAMADQFRKYSRQPDAGFIKSSVSVYASCGDFAKADSMRLELGKQKRDQFELENVDRRLGQWRGLYAEGGPARPHPRATAGFIKTAAAADEDDDDDAATASPAKAAPASAAKSPAAVPAAPPAPAAAQAPGPADGLPRMVLVDVVMVTTQELITTAKGINLLTALQLQLGSASQPAFSRSNSTTMDAITRSVTTDSSVITRALTVPALAYSLNIANASSTLNEVLARPTLAAMEGLPSEFFSGTNLNAGAVSTSSLGVASVVPVDKKFGVKLAVTPTFLPNGMVKMKVDAQRTFLNANVDSAGFAYRLEISETTASANVVMNLGDTLVLSGLSEKESDHSRTGVPGLQDIPGVQYLFSTKRTSDFQRSVLILITPRAPLYTSKMEGVQGAAMTDSMRALREKLGFSGRTPSNIESILAHLKTTSLFREFRQGDVSMERWDRMHSTGDRLRQALEFLYY